MNPADGGLAPVRRQDLTARSKAALDALRRANSEHHLPRGLLAHAEALWRAGDGAAAADNLRELDTIAARGPMPLFAAEAALLRARIALSEDRRGNAFKEREKAAELVDRHEYHRALPELAVLTAELAAATNVLPPQFDVCLNIAVEAVRGESHEDEETGAEIDGGWWGLLPRLDALLPDGHPARAELTAARDAYNAERDAYLAAEAAALEAELAKEWDEEDQHLADPAFRRELSELLTTNDHKPLDELRLGDQRGFAREYLKQKRQAESGQTEGMPDIPDEILDQFLAEPDARKALQSALQAAGIEEPLDELPREVQKAAVAAMLAAAQQASQDDEA